MGLRCLLGHDFDEPELQREREEDGDEVVTTVTEVKTCARCGETQIVSENTEVTTMEQLTDQAAAGATGATADSLGESGTAGPGSGRVGAEPGDEGSVHGDGTDAFGVEAGGASAEVDPEDVEPADVDDGETGTDDAVIIDDDRGASETEPEPAEPESTEPEPTETEAAEPDDAPTAEDEGAELLDEGVSTTDDDHRLGGEEGEYEEYPEVESAESRRSDERDADTDDGVILDEEPEPEPDRERGAWPEVEGDEQAGADPTPWPEQHGEDEGFSAEVGGDESGGVEFGGGLTPEAADEPVDEDAEYVDSPERDPDAEDTTLDADPSDAGATDGKQADEGAGFTRGESPDLGPTSSNVTTEYYCPECGMTREADGNSMRAGDICPECKRGYVNERPI